MATFRRLYASKRFDAVAVGLIVLASALYGIWRLRAVREWGVMTDELLYLKLGREVAHSWLPLPVVRGEHVDVYGMLYPVLIAPLIGLFDAASAITAIHYLNALLIASAAVPAFLLARLVTQRRLLALFVAAGTVCVPYISAASKITTEPLAYPVFTWAVLAIVYAVVRPSRRAELLALLAIALAFLTRTQFMYLFVMLPLIGVAHGALFEPRSLRVGMIAALRRHRISAAVAGLLMVVLVFAPDLILGNYAVTASGGNDGLLPKGIIHSAIVHIGTLALQLGGLTIPLALAFAAATLLQPETRERHAFAIALLAIGAASVYVVATFDTRFVGALSGIEPSELVRERYLFYLVPIALTGAAAFFADAGRWRRQAAIGAVVAGALGALTIVEASMRTDGLIPSFDSPGRIFNIVLVGRVIHLRDLTGIDALQPGNAAMILTIVALAMLAIVIWRGHRAVAAVAALGMVFAYIAAETWYVVPRVYHEQNGLSYYLGPRTEAQRTWIDRVAGDKPVGLLSGTVTARGETPYFDPYLNGALWWDAEFWNDRVDSYYKRNGLDLTMPPYRDAELNRDLGTLVAPGENTDYLVATQHNPLFQISGKPVRLQGDLALYRVSWPVQLTWATEDVFPDGWTNAAKGADARVDLYGRRGTGFDVSLLLSNGPAADDKPRRVEISLPGVPTRRVKVNAAKIVRLKACVRTGRPVPLRLRSAGMAEGDRRIGVRVASVTATPTARCGTGSAR